MLDKLFMTFFPPHLMMTISFCKFSTSSDIFKNFLGAVHKLELFCFTRSRSVRHILFLFSKGKKNIFRWILKNVT